jgi:hypothetical protein
MSPKVWIASIMVVAGGIGFAQSAWAQNDCHANVQTHHVQGLGMVAHSHSQNCDIVIPQGSSAGGLVDCHSHVQTHGPGVHAGGTSPHSHSGFNCGYQAAPGVGIQVPGLGIQLNID